MEASQLGIVIPCYQEATRFNCVHWPLFAAQYPHWDFLFVDDGSSDATFSILQNLVAQTPTQNIKAITTAHQGKAAAVQIGIQTLLKGHGPYQGLGFYDADLATPLTELARLGNLFLSSPSSPTTPTPSNMADALFASRIQYLGTTIKRHAYRHYLGRIFATAVSLLVDLPVYDSQCGLKLFKTTIAAQIFQRKFVSPWFFDVELILRLKALHAVIRECPLLEWSDMGGSKLGWRDFAKTPLELAKIYWQYRHDDHVKNDSAN
jgi:glycosyltransferase involved in cell wall biosynthesis